MSASSAPSFATSSRRASRTPWVVLGLLAYEPMTGYDLKAAIQATVGHFWQESYGQLYPTLHALRDDGLVTMTHEADGGRTRNVYAITDEGRAAVLAWLAEDPRPTPVRNELLLKVFFASHAGPDALRPHLETARARAREQRHVLGAIRDGIANEPASDHERFCWSLTVDLGLRNADAAEAWALAALDALDERDAKDSAEARA